MRVPFFNARSSRRGAPLPLPIATFAGVIVTMLAVLVIAYVTYRTQRTRQAAVEGINHRVAVIQQLDLLLTSVTSAESSQRGFLLTGDGRYLAPFADAQLKQATAVAALQGLLAADTRQQQRLRSAEQLGQQKLNELQRTIALRRDGDVEGALALVRTDEGQALMERLSALVREMDAEEQSLLADRQAVARQIIHAHGGRIEARSDDGETVFSVVMPRRAPVGRC